MLVNIKILILFYIIIIIIIIIIIVIIILNFVTMLLPVNMHKFCKFYFNFYCKWYIWKQPFKDFP